MGGVGSAGPDEISHAVNVAACAGCAAEGEARGRPGWDRAEGAETGGSAREQVALHTGGTQSCPRRTGLLRLPQPAGDQPRCIEVRGLATAHRSQQGS